MAKFKIGIVGAGNVGSHLCRAFSKAGHQITVYTRRGATHLLDDVKGLRWTENLRSLRYGNDFVLIAVNDDHIEDVAKEIALEDGILMHTSGSRSMEILKDHAAKYGVFYPLQSFRVGRDLHYEEIPVFIEANNALDLNKIRKLTKYFTNRTEELDSAARKKLHLAAVIVNNFTNHLYTISQDYLKETDVDFKLLVPLVRETARRLEEGSPELMQTGPARRKDQEVIVQHLDMLRDHKEMKELYNLFTESIRNRYTDT